MLRNYTTHVYSGRSYQKPQTRNTAKLAVVGVYAGVALVGLRLGGPAGAGAAVMAVPEVVTVPILLS